MKTKTFKLGEVCQGGIITVEVKKGIISVIGKEWDYSKGSNKGSDQSGAKEFTRLDVREDDDNAQRQLMMFIQDLTTSYHTEQVMEFIKANSKIKTSMFWG